MLLTMGMAKTSLDFDQLRASALNINRVFAGITPIISQTRLLSLNAEIASALTGKQGDPFRVAVKDLLVMSGELSKLIGEVEIVFHEVANYIAKWVAAEMRLNIFQRSLDSVWDLSGEDNNSGDIKECDKYQWDSTLCDGVIAKWKSHQNKCDKYSIEYQLWSHIIDSGNEALKNLYAVEKLTKKLSRFIDNIRMIAVRQSHFISVTAMIESTRVEDDSSDLSTVALSIRELSSDIANLEDNAHDHILSLISMVSRATSFAKSTKI